MYSSVEILFVNSAINNGFGNSLILTPTLWQFNPPVIKTNLKTSKVFTFLISGVLNLCFNAIN